MTAIVDHRPVGFFRRRSPREPSARVERVLVIVPTSGEGRRIVATLARVRSAFPTADVLVVDDRSGNGTAECATRLAKHLGRITVIDQPTGSHTAWQAGSDHGTTHGYDIVVELHPEHSVIQPPRVVVSL